MSELGWGPTLILLFAGIAITCFICVRESRRVPRLPKHDPKADRHCFKGDWK